MTPRHAIAAVLALGALVVGRASAADADWKVGLAQIKITPEQPVFLSGYANRNKPYEKITADLYAKALALEDANGQKAVLVTTDLLGLPAAVSEPICDRLRERHGLRREQVLFNSSHIHTGPALALDPTPRDNRTAGDSQRTVAYTKQLQDRLVEVVGKALEHREPAKLSWGTGVVHFVMNRREFTPRGVILGVNPRGPADRTVPVLRVDAPDGKPRAILVGAATHNTTLTGDCYEDCGDYAGFAQEQLQQKYPGVQAMFMLGLAGDSNPYPRGTMEMSRAHGATLATEVGRVLETKLQPVRGPLKVAFDRATLPLQPREALEKQAKQKDLPGRIAQQSLERLKNGEKLLEAYSCPLSVWQFGDDLTLVGLSGEVVVDYVFLLEKALGPNQLWLSAYCNDVFGYLPSARVLSEGGYEDRGLYSGGLGLFDPRAQDVLVAKVRALAEKVGRKLPEALK
jgi:neutral ceramidase